MHQRWEVRFQAWWHPGRFGAQKGTGSREGEPEKRESGGKVLIPGKEGSRGTAPRKVGVNPSSAKIVPAAALISTPRG